MRNMYFFLLFVLFFPLITFSQQTGTSADTNCSQVLAERAQKDQNFRNPATSILIKEDIPGFNGLHYYPCQQEYRVEATLTRFQNPKIIRMKTSTERRPEYRIYGEARFVLHGIPCTLTLYQPVELSKEPGFERYLFLPFTDETSARQTYGSGRFLELVIPVEDTIILDFNRCFNPYCAYNPKYSCPIPPRENDLPLAIGAGEKVWKKSEGFNH